MANDYLDFFNIFVNELAGSEALFIILALVGVAFLLVRAKTPMSVFLYTMIGVVGMLAIWFEVLRWFVVILGLGFVGSTLYSRLRRE